MALLMSSIMLIARSHIAAIYSPNAEVVAVASGLLAWLALFHLGDATQAMCVFVLRCYRVVIAPFIAYAVLLWGVGLVGGYALAYEGIGPLAAQHSPAAFWSAGALALLLVAPSLAAILWRAARRYSN
jgi:MATE family multidrug resistance protein